MQNRRSDKTFWSLRKRIQLHSTDVMHTPDITAAHTGYWMKHIIQTSSSDTMKQYKPNNSFPSPSSGKPLVMMYVFPNLML